MKKILLIAALIFITAVFVAITNKLDFYESTSYFGCYVFYWVEDTYEDGVRYKHYANVVCNDAEKLPDNMGGLKFISAHRTYSGQYSYSYGEPFRKLWRFYW